MNQKSPRTTFNAEIQKIERKKNYPEPATYQLSYKLITPKITGCFSFQSDRSGYLDESAVIGLEQAPYFDKNYKLVE